MTPEQARADERAKVVAWLREQAAKMLDFPAWATELHAEREAFEAAANAIERGDHDKEQG